MLERPRSHLRSLGRDLRTSARSLVRAPSLTALAVLTLALGIGATAAVFSVLDSVMLKPFPFEHQDRIALLWHRDEPRHQPFVEISYPMFEAWRDGSRGFEALAAMASVNYGVVWTGGGAEPVQIQGRLVSGEFFDVLGTRALLGRALAPADNRHDSPHVVVISHGLWARAFGADPDTLGRTVTLDGTPTTIVGVMPAAFAYPPGADVWVPVVPTLPQSVLEDTICWAVAIGRMRPGLDLAGARSELDRIIRESPALHHRGEPLVSVITPVVEELLGDMRPRLQLISAAVGLFLIVACSNVAGLLLVRAITRRRELAVRIALGASRGAVLRLLLCESALLACAGGGAGVLLAAWAVGAIAALGPRDLPRLQDAALDGRVLLFALATAILAALISGLVPALHALRREGDGVPREDAGGSVGGRSGHRLRALLVASEVAFAVVLLFGAGLLVHSFVRLRGVDLGFDPTHVLTMEVAVADAEAAKPASLRLRQAALVQKVAALPGVESAALVLLRPLWGHVGMDWYFTVEGQSPEDAARNPLLNLEAVTPDYFRTMGIRLLAGRDFDARDADGAPGVVVVSRQLAARYWPGADPIGKRLRMAMPGTRYDKQWMAVVGVVADARYRELEAARLDVYVSHLQSNDPLRHLVVRTTGDPTAIAASVRGVVRAAEPEKPVDDVATMDAIVATALRGSRFGAQVLAALALLALALASVGLYGVMAQAAAQRTREIGVRMALGARARDVVALVARQGLGPAAAGAAIGFVASLIGARVLRRLLFEIGPADPASLAAVASALLVVAALASAVPARRAARVDPMRALRHE